MSLFQGGAVLKQNPVFCPFANPNHDRSWRGQPHGARAGDDQHRDQPQQAGDKCPSRCKPDDKSEGGQDDNRRYKPGGYLIDDSLDRRFAALRLFNQADNLSQGTVPADVGGPQSQQPLFVDGGSDRVITNRFFNRQTFAGDHALIDR